MKSRTHISPVQDQKADELISNITQLMAEAEEMLSESTSHHAEEKVALLRYGQDRATNGFGARYSEVKARLASVARQTDATVREFPYESVLVALGIGLILGTTLGGSKRKNALARGF
jgi:ElaB/YqjD/DUF883 family membrane-anchored ribosome-binding protein